MEFTTILNLWLPEEGTVTGIDVDICFQTFTSVLAGVHVTAVMSSRYAVTVKMLVLVLAGMFASVLNQKLTFIVMPAGMLAMVW